MTTIKSINIPKPCHESWQQMAPAHQGRHCQLCCKTVTDFTSMTNNEIINYLASVNNVCGRFGEQQLNNINHHLYAQTPTAGAWKRWLMMIGLLGSTMFFKAEAQTKNKPVMVKVPAKSNKLAPDSMILGKIAMPVKQTKKDTAMVFNKTIGGKYTQLQCVVGGIAIEGKRQSFMNRTWHKIKGIF
jgi:hypothetical protein